MLYSRDGNRIGEQSSDGVQKTYSYDKLGQLTAESIIKNGLTANTSYTYDNRGNRLTKSVGDSITNYSYDANNRLRYETTDKETTEYFYDGNGNMVAKNMGTYSNSGTPGISLSENPLECEYYTYDLLNRLTGVETNDVSAQYSYYVDNLRKTKTVGDSITGYAWSNGNLVAESTGAVYNYAIDGIAFGGNEFYVKNGYGDTTAIADIKGTEESTKRTASPSF